MSFLTRKHSSFLVDFPRVVNCWRQESWTGPFSWVLWAWEDYVHRSGDRCFKCTNWHSFRESRFDFWADWGRLNSGCFICWRTQPLLLNPLCYYSCLIHIGSIKVSQGTINFVENRILDLRGFLLWKINLIQFYLLFKEVTLWHTTFGRRVLSYFVRFLVFTWAFH